MNLVTRRGDFKSSNERAQQIYIKYASKLYRRPANQSESDSSMPSKVQDAYLMLLVFIDLKKYGFFH